MLALMPLTGCVIPYCRTIPAEAFETHPAEDGSGGGTRYVTPRIRVAEAGTGAAIDDAMAVVVVHRCKATGMCCSATSSPREPLVDVVRFAKLADLTYRRAGVIVLLPFWVDDLGTQYQYASVFAYKVGYVPVEVRLEQRGAAYRYPDPV